MTTTSATDKSLFNNEGNDLLQAKKVLSSSNIEMNEHDTKEKEKEKSPANNINKNLRKNQYNILPDNPSKYQIDYEVINWIFIVFFTLVAVIDRYTINLWPLWVDSPGPTIPGNPGVTVFSIVAWISSRMLIVSSSYIFLFRCYVFYNWVAERKIMNKYIYIGDIHQSNVGLHYHVGIWLIGVPVILHVWSIVFAACFPQNDVELYNSWMRPEDPSTGKSISFYADDLLSLGINDVYRIVSTSLVFFILIPYSIIKFFRNRNWSLAQYIHLLGATIYTIDLLRMKSHPHCWVFNIPFILMWMIDRLYGIYWYRRSVALLVHKTKLDNDYIILYLRIPEHLHNIHTIGDVYWFNKLDFGWDKAHPFTVYQNHNRNKKMYSIKNTFWDGHKFKLNKNDNDNNINWDLERLDTISSQRSTSNIIYNGIIDDNKEDDDDDTCNDDQDQTKLIQKKNDNNDQFDDIDSNKDWNIAIIMQVVPKHTKMYYRDPWTNEMLKSNPRYFAALRAWGPYRSEYRMLLRGQYTSSYPLTPIILIGTGAGCSYLIDYYNYINSNNISLSEKVHFYFSTRSIPMFQWFTNITCKKNINNLFVQAHLTSHDDIIYKKDKQNNIIKTRESKIGRISFKQIFDKLSKNTEIYFCGSPVVQEIVRKLCKNEKLKFHAGHSFH